MEILLGLLKFLVVMLLPVAVAVVADRFVQLAAEHEFKTVPILQHLSKLHGIAIGGVLIYTNFSGRYFDLERLFMTDSPWSIPFTEFVTVRSNMFAYALAPFFERLAQPDANPEILAAAIALAVLPAACIAVAFRLWPASTAWRAIFACGVRAIATAWMTVYLVALTFWGLYLLNFWALAFIAAYYQYRRYHTGHA